MERNITEQFDGYTSVVRNMEIDFAYVAETGNNEDADRLYRLHHAMSQQFLMKAIKGIASQRLDAAKATIEELSDELGLEEVAQGSSSIVFEDDIFAMKVRVNKSRESVNVHALKTELIRAGVSQEVIDKCYLKATTVQKPQKIIEVIPK